jgi:heterodisulfide reductase subunit D
LLACPGGGGMSEDFEPTILVFACSWCGYPAATLTGVHHLSYPSGVKIIRVMCTGRVEPAFMMKAFECGADGVAVVGCRIDDCHYTDGNKHAQKRIEAVRKLLRYTGLGEERLRCEWLSASEKYKFLNLINGMYNDLKTIGPNPIPKVERKEAMEFDKKAIDDLIADTGAHDCVECGKCTSVCPVARFDPNFAPRVIVLRALEGVSDSLSKDRDIWSCITCEMCNSMCPYKVDYSGFIQGMRSEAIRLGNEPECSQGGLLQSMMRVMAQTEKQNRLEWIPKDVRIAEKGDILYFVGCAPHLDAVFYDRNLNLTGTAISAIKILNYAGIVPVVSNDEVCCGHDLNWAGDNENFEKLMERNIEMIKNIGAKKVIFSCPECYRTFNIDYQDILGDQDFEMMHLTEFLADLIDEGKLELKPVTEEGDSVTYHDPCRLGRHLGVYDEPRDILREMGVEVKEMANTRDKAQCCGVSAWITCGKPAKQMQLDRIAEAKRTGARRLLTMCPKCRIHLDCAVSKEVDVDRSLIDIPMEDYVSYLAKRLGL